MAKHSPKFLEIVAKAAKNVRECDVSEVKKRLDQGDKFTLIDCREDNEWQADHIPGAIHLGKGIIERDIEMCVPDVNSEIVIYCGGGYRSALATASLQEMGYRKVTSMAGGIKAWRDAKLPLQKPK